MNFQLLFPNQIILAEGASTRLGEIIKNRYDKPLLLRGKSLLKNGEYYNKIMGSLKDSQISFCEMEIPYGEPSPESIDNITEYAKREKIASVIAIGGGSVIDTGKAVAALAVNESGVENYLEGVGKGFKIKNVPLPFIAIPTTAGSGAEATKNAVVSSLTKKYKKSFRDEHLLARIIIGDPFLTLSLPQQQTAYSGIDAISQLVESFVTKNGNPFVKSLCSYFIPVAIESLIKVYQEPLNIEARSNMLLSSIISGFTLANAGLGAVHGLASGLGGMFDIPHGLICGVLLPGVCKMNSEQAPQIYKELAKLVNKNQNDDIDDLICQLKKLNEMLHLPPDFKQFALPRNKAKEIVERSLGGSMKGNPLEFPSDVWEKFIINYL